MTLLRIRPLSINVAWQGRRYKTYDYLQHEKEMFILLPRTLKIPKGKMKLSIVFGFSNKASDIDNPVKLLTDILQKRYGFNDQNIYKLEVEKRIVKKGREYIDFDLKELK